MVDQFEEILIASTDELAQVAAVLGHCLRPRSRLALLTALRADFLGQALQHRDLAELVQDTRLVTVGELSQSQLRAAIVEPVRRTKMVRYEAGLIDRLLTDVDKAPGRLPLLQFTLAMLWENQDSGVLTHRAYDALGGVESALAGHAEAVWSGLGSHERRAAGRLLVQLLYPITSSTGFVGRAVPRTYLDDAQWTAAQRLAADQRWRASRGADLSPAERSYLDTCRRQRTRLWTTWTALAAAIAVVVGLVLIQREHQKALQVASDASRNLLRFASETDPYAELRTILRAYRTSANFTTEGRVGGAYRQYARIDQVLPDYTARPIPVPNQRPYPAEPPSSMAQKVSADGQTLVTTDPQDNVTLWRVEGSRVTGRALGQTARRATVSRDGRYVAYLQDTMPRFVLNGPRNLCRGEKVSHCVYLHDTVTGQTRQLGTMNASLGVPIIRFDPTGQVLAAMFPPEVLKQRLVTWEVASGRQRDDIIVPVSEPVSEIAGVDDLWLAPGGHRLLLRAQVTRYPWSRLGYTVLASVDLTGPSPVFTQIVSDTLQYTVSGDGGRVAALVAPQSSDDEHKKPVVWDVATGQKIAEGPALSKEQSLGEIALDLHGERVFVTAYGTGTVPVSVWRVGETTLQPATLHISGWEEVLPLGSGEDAPLLLVDRNVVGLVLAVPGRPTPMQRLAAPVPDVYSSSNNRAGQWFSEMSSMLASGVPVADELKDLPAGTYSGPLGG